MMGDWTFFSNYGHVLVCLANNREARLRDVALEVGITERAVQKIVRDLQDAGHLTVSKQGRCNRYRINRRKSLRHSLESGCTVGKLLTLVAKKPGSVKEEDFSEGLPVPETEAAPRAERPRVEPPAGNVPPRKDPPRKEPAAETPEPVKPADTRQQGSLF